MMEITRDNNGNLRISGLDNGYPEQATNSISANLLYEILQELKELNRKTNRLMGDIQEIRLRR